MDWLDLALDMDQNRALVNAVMKFPVPENFGKIFEYLHNWRLLKKGSAPWS
jgi:hypothetical protein